MRSINIVVIGGGPAGMMAAGTAAAFGASVVLLEKNEKLGKKLFITGKGRCNVTNNTDVQGLISHTVSNPRFLQSAFHAMNSQDLIEFFENLDLPLKTEQGQRVFPVSDKAGHVTDALAAYMQKFGVKVKLNCAVHEICHPAFKIRHSVLDTESLSNTLHSCEIAGQARNDFSLHNDFSLRKNFSLPTLCACLT